MQDNNIIKRYLYFSALIIILGVVVGCNSEKVNLSPDTDDAPVEAIVDYNVEYKDVLGKIYKTVVSACNTDVPEEGYAGIWEAALVLENDALSQIGYVLMDINEDTIPELLIGAFDKKEYAYTNNELYAAFTLENGEPVLMFEGRSRSSYSLKDDGSFFYEGSNGAAYSILGEYFVSKDIKLECRDYYFTYPNDNNPADVEIYHNTTGEWDKDKSERLDITLDDFWILQEEAAKATVKLTATPFAELDVDIIAKAMEVKPASDSELLDGDWIDS